MLFWVLLASIATGLYFLFGFIKKELSKKLNLELQFDSPFKIRYLKLNKKINSLIVDSFSLQIQNLGLCWSSAFSFQLSAEKIKVEISMKLISIASFSCFEEENVNFMNLIENIRKILLFIRHNKEKLGKKKSQPPFLVVHESPSIFRIVFEYSVRLIIILILRMLSIRFNKIFFTIKDKGQDIFLERMVKAKVEGMSVSVEYSRFERFTIVAKINALSVWMYKDDELDGRKGVLRTSNISALFKIPLTNNPDASIAGSKLLISTDEIFADFGKKTLVSIPVLIFRTMMISRINKGLYYTKNPDRYEELFKTELLEKEYAKIVN